MSITSIISMSLALTLLMCSPTYTSIDYIDKYFPKDSRIREVRYSHNSCCSWLLCGKKTLNKEYVALNAFINEKAQKPRVKISGNAYEYQPLISPDGKNVEDLIKKCLPKADERVCSRERMNLWGALSKAKQEHSSSIQATKKWWMVWKK